MVKSEGSTATVRPPRNYAIDALRFIAICFVVYIHIFELNKGVVYSEKVSWQIIDILFGISRLAVPLFFAISGWFIFSADRTEQVQKLQKQIPKLVTILVVASVVSGIVLFIFDKFHLMYSNSLPYALQIKSLFEMFTLGRSPTIGTLWFLVSLIIVEFIYWLVTRNLKRDNWMIVVAIVFFGFTIAFGSYRTVTGLPVLPFPPYETWFLGFAWFSLGYFLAKFFKNRPGLIRTRTLAYSTATAGALYLYEYILHTSGSPFVFGPYNYDAVFIFTPFVVAGILLLAARSTIDTAFVRRLASWGKRYALGVFIIHLVVMQPVNVFFTHFNLLADDPIFKLVVTYTGVVALSFGLTAAYYKAKERIYASYLTP